MHVTKLQAKASMDSLRLLLDLKAKKFITMIVCIGMSSYTYICFLVFNVHALGHVDSYENSAKI